MWVKRLLIASLAGCSRSRSRNRPESPPRDFIRLLRLDPMSSSKRSAPWWTRSSDVVAHEGPFWIGRPRSETRAGRSAIGALQPVADHAADGLRCPEADLYVAARIVWKQPFEAALG